MSEQPRQPEPAGVRPAGKRQVSGVSTTSSDAYAAKKAVVRNDAEKDTERSLLKKATDYVPETVEEMKKVIWPTARQMVIYTLIVFAFLIILTALVWGVDTLAGLGVEKVLGYRPKL